LADEHFRICPHGGAGWIFEVKITQGAILKKVLSLGQVFPSQVTRGTTKRIFQLTLYSWSFQPPFEHDIPKRLWALAAVPNIQPNYRHWSTRIAEKQIMLHCGWHSTMQTVRNMMIWGRVQEFLLVDVKNW
jgi:hypothetical protein